MLGILLAAQLAIVAHAADTVGACEPLDLSVAVSARGTQLPRLVAPPFAPFDVMRSVTIPHVERDTRAVPSVTVEYRFVLVADRPGAYTIPPFEARIGNETARSAPLRIHVVPSNADATPTVLTRAGIDTGTRLDLRATHPDTVYVGQQANYTVAVFLNDAVRRRLRRNPTFYPPDMQSMLAYDVPSAGTEQQTVGGSSCFEALVYRRALFPLQSGRLVIPPAQLTYALPSGASFFSREETHELQTDSAVVIAVDPPATGQPAGFDGAVGRFRVDTRVGAPSGRVGDPLTVTVRVSGTGNVKLLPRPHLTVPWASAVPSDERVQVDSTGARIGGAKEFDWVLTPRTPGDLDVPAVRYVYFDPGLRRYAVAGAGVVRVRIAPGALAAIDTSHRASGLSVRTVYHGPAGAPLSSHPIFWLLLTLAPVPALRARWRNRRRRARGARPVPPMTRLASAAAVAGRDAASARALRRSYVAALAERLAVDAEDFTTAGALRRALRRAGVAADTASQAEALLHHLDAAAFSGTDRDLEDAGARALALVRRIDDEALPRHELPYRALSLFALALIALGGTLHALQGSGPADTFANGVVAYQEHNYAGARADFARVAVAVPRAADAWVNFGTAAWAAHDTANAVLGWRRGLGLQPFADDARDRLGMVHGLRMSSPGYVPPVPLNLLLLCMAACWIVACVGWHPAWRTRLPWGARLAAPLAGAAAVGALGAIALGGRLSGRGVAVVRGDAMLRDDPAFGTDRGPTVVTGEMVRVLRQEGAWERVQLDGGRQGWMPAEGLVAVDAPLSSSLD